MALRTPEEYKASLRDGRAVYYKGQRVADVTEHPELRIAVEHAAIDFRMGDDPAHADLAVVDAPDGGKMSRYFQLPQTADDLLKRSRLIEESTRLGATLVVLAKEIGTDALAALHIVAHAMDEQLRTEYLERVKSYHEYCWKNDLAMSVAQTDVKGDRSLGPGEQEHPDYYVHVVSQNENGIVVRGAKVHTSLAPNANEIVVLPTRALREGDEPYAVAFAVPANAPGLKLITSSYGPSAGKSPFTHPISSSHKMVETLTVFDDVRVPWDRVFLNGEWQFAGPLALGFVEFHRFTAVSYKLPLCDLLVGAAQLVAEYNGVERASHIRDKITRLITYAETVRHLTHMAAIRCQVRPPGVAVPDPLIVNMAKYHFATNYHQAVSYLQDVTGGLIVTGPGTEDLENETLRPYLEKYFGGRKGTSAVDRLKAVNLVRDLTAGDFGGYQEVLAIHAEGSIEAEKLTVYRQYNLEKAKEYARHLARIEG